MRFGKRGRGADANGREAGARRLLVLADVSGRSSRGIAEASAQVAARPAVRIKQEDFDEAVRAIAPRLSLAGQVVGDVDPLVFTTLEDFHPDSLCRQLGPRLAAAPPGAAAPGPTSGRREDEAATLSRLLGRSSSPAPAATSTLAARSSALSAVEELAARAIAAQGGPASQAGASLDPGGAAQVLRGVLHDPAFQALEANWRGLELLASRLDEDTELFLLDITRQELGALAADQHALAARLSCAPGGKPWTALVGAFSFGPDAEDVALLTRLAAFGASAGAPFVAAGAPALLGLTSWTGAGDAGAWPGLVGDEAARWADLRRDPSARWLALATPRFLARAPYGAKSGGGPIDAFPFEEMPGRPDAAGLLWSNPAFLCAVLLMSDGDVESAGEVPDLPFVSYRVDGESEMYPSAEVFLSERAATALITRGLTPLVCARDRNSVRVPAFASLAEPSAPLGAGR